MAEGLSYEAREYLDVLDYKPGDVTTNLNKETNIFTAITAKRAADVCFRDLGYSYVTRGAFRHEFLSWILANLVPISYLDQEV